MIHDPVLPVELLTGRGPDSVRTVFTWSRLRGLAVDRQPAALRASTLVRQ